MDRIKKNIKRIWNSKCKYLVIVACGLILANGVNLLQAGLKFMNSDGFEQEEKKLIEITSNGWESGEPGSFKVTKSAEWTDIRKATIQFDVETRGKNNRQMRDVILVLDNSDSMSGNKLKRLKEDASSFVDFLLLDENNNVAVITFNSRATIESPFTNDKNQVISAIHNISATGGTNFSDAYQETIHLLSAYHQDSQRDLVMLFLTDGIGRSAEAKYQILKDKYNITIIGIQYELGTSMKQSIIDISDRQYIANTANLKDVFFESIGVESYEEFEITDYIAKEFTVKNISDIRVSRGSVKLETLEDGIQKIIWTIARKDLMFITSFGATMEIDVFYNGELNPDRAIATNQKEEVKTKLPGIDEEEKESEDTPQLRGGYYVTYNPNLPRECNPDNKDLTIKEAYFPYEKVDRHPQDYTCSGWQIKEWNFDEITTSAVTLASDDKFIMPSHDVKVTAVWTKVDIDKKMEGTVYEIQKQDLLVAMKENAGNTMNVDSSINFGSPSSASNGRGLYIRSGTQNDKNPIYYYRGAVENNHVLFAGICWQIVRTTETGGVKLIYNGVSSDGTTCQSTSSSKAITSPFNSKYTSSLSNIGYMNGGNVSASCGSVSSRYKWGTTISYNSSTDRFSLSDILNAKTPDSSHHYTCQSGSLSACYSNIYYAYYVDEIPQACYISLSSGNSVTNLGEAQNVAFKNEKSSSIKDGIDNWYKTNIDSKGYTKYLEDAVWCNDRKITGGSLYSSTSSYGATIFGAYGNRRLHTTSANPAVKESVACSNLSDRFTVNAATGNKALTYPVGTLTADEVLLAGISHSSSQDSYLYTGFSYWTMTPYWFGDSYGSYSYNFSVTSTGSLLNSSTSVSQTVRPSISLKKGTMVYGDGTIGNPYEVVME